MEAETRDNNINSQLLQQDNLISISLEKVVITTKIIHIKKDIKIKTKASIKVVTLYLRKMIKKKFTLLR